MGPSPGMVTRRLNLGVGERMSTRKRDVLTRQFGDERPIEVDQNMAVEGFGVSESESETDESGGVDGEEELAGYGDEGRIRGAIIAEIQQNPYGRPH